MYALFIRSVNPDSPLFRSAPFFFFFHVFRCCIAVHAVVLCLRVFVYYAEVTSLISPWEKPEAICKIPLIKKWVQIQPCVAHTQSHGGTYRISTRAQSHVCVLGESYLLSKLEHVWASVFCQSALAHACWTAVERVLESCQSPRPVLIFKLAV